MDKKVSCAIALIGSIIAIWAFAPGCGDPRRFWIGTWVGKRTLPNEASIPEQFRGTLTTVKLVISNDERFELTEAGIPFGGDAALRTDDASLTIKTQLGRPIDSLGEGAVNQNKPLILKRQPDGSILYTDPGGFHTEPVRLTRKAPASKTEQR